MSDTRTVGALPTWRLERVDENRMKVLALLLGDPNPIHFDPEATERMLGTRAVVNQGPSNIAMLYHLLQQAYPRGHVTRLSADLLGNVCGGDAVTAGGTVRSARADEVTVDVELSVDGGAVVLRGTADVMLPTDPTHPDHRTHPDGPAEAVDHERNEN